MLALFIGAAVLLFSVFAPFLAVLALAVVFAVLLHSPYEWLVHSFEGRKSAAALITVGAMLVFFIVPLFFLGGRIFQEAQGLYASMYDNQTEYLTIVRSAFERPLQNLFPGFQFDFNAAIGNAVTFISDNLGSLVYQTLYVIFNTFLMLLALFFFLRDGRKILSSLVAISPFGKGATVEILDEMQTTIRSIVRGTLFIVVIRWVCIGFAFFLFGIPNAVLWSSVGGVIGAIPGLGTFFAFAPAVVYLYLAGHVLAAFGLALFGIVTIALTDNILTSYFLGRGLPVPPIFVLFSILGGILFFGPLGFILGPLVLSVFLSVIHAYRLNTRS